jgi:formiminoglutamase
MTLPILISVPHGGLTVPDELQANCLLDLQQITQDGDKYALEIYAPLETEVAAFVSTDIARAVIDMNRAEDDIRKDGVVKTHTCWEVPIWHKPLDNSTIQHLLESYHKPYHRRLSALAKQPDLILAVDCHTMAATGPPVGPDPDEKRPQVCLGNASGESCPDEWMEILQSSFQRHFPGKITVNQPFSGGYITRHHGHEMPWVQIEISRGEFATPAKKSKWIRDALRESIIKILNQK